MKTGYSPGFRFTIKTAVYITILFLLHFCCQFLLRLSTSQSIALLQCETRPPTDKLWSWRNASSFLSSHHFPTTSLLPLKLSIIWRLLGFNPPVPGLKAFFPTSDILLCPQPTGSVVSLCLYSYRPLSDNSSSCSVTGHLLRPLLLCTSCSSFSFLIHRWLFMYYQDKYAAYISNLGGMWKYSVSYSISSDVTL